MDYSNIGNQLWDFILMIAGFMSDIWLFLTTELSIGSITFFGITITEGFTFTPIQLGLPVIIAIVTAGLISLFSPI